MKVATLLEKISFKSLWGKIKLSRGSFTLKLMNGKLKTRYHARGWKHSGFKVERVRVEIDSARKCNMALKSIQWPFISESRKLKSSGSSPHPNVLTYEQRH